MKTMPQLPDQPALLSFLRESTFQEQIQPKVGVATSGAWPWQHGEDMQQTTSQTAAATTLDQMALKHRGGSATQAAAHAQPAATQAASGTHGHGQPASAPTQQQNQQSTQSERTEGTSRSAATSRGESKGRYDRQHLLQSGTPLQKHCLFYDRDGDGMITMWDTYLGLRAIGLGIFLSILGTLFINLGLAWPTSESWLPTTTINVNRIGRSMHGSDSGCYTHDGQFDEERFNKFFARYDTDGTGYLSWSKIWARIRTERDFFDLFGWTATFQEWGLLYYVAAEPGKGLSKETVRGVFDGSLFYRLEEHATAKRQAEAQQRKAKWSSSGSTSQQQQQHHRGQQRQH